MMTEKIKALLKVVNMNVVQLAKESKTSSQNLYNKLSRDNFSEKELQEIADITGAELEINFIIKVGNKTIKI